MKTYYHHYRNNSKILVKQLNRYKPQRNSLSITSEKLTLSSRPSSARYSNIRRNLTANLSSQIMAQKNVMIPRVRDTETSPYNPLDDCEYSKKTSRKILILKYNNLNSTQTMDLQPKSAKCSTNNSRLNINVRISRKKRVKAIHSSIETKKCPLSQIDLLSGDRVPIRPLFTFSKIRLRKLRKENHNYPDDLLRTLI